MEARLQDPLPLVFALAEAKDYGKDPHSVKTFQGVYVASSRDGRSRIEA